MRLSQRTLWVCLLRSSLKVCHVRFQAALILTPSLDFKGFEAIVLDGKEADANYKEIYEKYELDTLVDICVRYKPQQQQQQ